MPKENERYRFLQIQAKKAAALQRRKLLEEPHTAIERVVGQDALDSEYDDPWGYIKDVVEHGCESGMVPGLVYYSETAEFYDKYKNEIWDIFRAEADAGTSVLAYVASLWDIDDPDVMENNMAWHAYEVVAQELLRRSEEPEDYV
jgi:hypothetical protein